MIFFLMLERKEISASCPVCSVFLSGKLCIRNDAHLELKSYSDTFVMVKKVNGVCDLASVD